MQELVKMRSTNARILKDVTRRARPSVSIIRYPISLPEARATAKGMTTTQNLVSAQFENPLLSLAWKKRKGLIYLQSGMFYQSITGASTTHQVDIVFHRSEDLQHKRENPWNEGVMTVMLIALCM